MILLYFNYNIFHIAKGLAHVKTNCLENNKMAMFKGQIVIKTQSYLFIYIYIYVWLGPSTLSANKLKFK
jgi:hypothetical protein